jgi:hypothetical protein
MASLNPEQLDDLVNLTQDRYRKKSWLDISLDNQFYVFEERFMKKKKLPVKGGPRQVWKLQVRNTGNARFTGLFSNDQTNIRNLSASAQQEWAMSTVNFSYDVNEPEFQGDDVTMIVDEIKMREHSMYTDWYALMEETLWTAPTSSAQNPRPLSGIPFWIQKNATEGFNGGDPAGFAGGAGNVASATVPRWKNYTFTYGGVTRNDLVAKWLRAVHFCQFRAPHKYPELGGGKPDWEFWTTWDLLEPLYQYMDARNDNLKDVAGVADATFKGIPVNWCPELTNNTQGGYDATNPLYGINWRTFEHFFMKGKEMVRHKAEKLPDSHNGRVVHMDSISNILCLNRRCNFVAYQN